MSVDGAAQDIGRVLGIFVIVLFSGFVSIILFMFMVDWMTGSLAYGIVAGLLGGAFVMIGVARDLVRKTR